MVFGCVRLFVNTIQANNLQECHQVIHTSYLQNELITRRKDEKLLDTIEELVDRMRRILY